MTDYGICCYGMRHGEARAGLAEFHIEIPTANGVKDIYFCSEQCLAVFKQDLQSENVGVIEPYLERDTNRLEGYEDRARREEQRLELFHSDPGVALSDPSYGNRK